MRRRPEPLRNDAILRHGWEAKPVIDGYRALTPSERAMLLTFLDSL
jgi:CxxC motif-containing protein (DUF1111 family)